MTTEALKLAIEALEVARDEMYDTGLIEQALHACQKALEHEQTGPLSDEQIHHGIKSTTEYEIPPYNAGFTAGVRYAEKHFGVGE